MIQSRAKVRLTSPKMWLVSGGQQNLSSIPRGMKIISELQNISKSKDPMAWEALACVTVYALHVMLNGHIDTPANPNWRLTKKNNSSHLAPELYDQHMDTQR